MHSFTMIMCIYKSYLKNSKIEKYVVHVQKIVKYAKYNFILNLFAIIQTL